jgi:hypothetical protein
MEKASADEKRDERAEERLQKKEAEEWPGVDDYDRIAVRTQI